MTINIEVIGSKSVFVSRNVKLNECPNDSSSSEDFEYSIEKPKWLDITLDKSP